MGNTICTYEDSSREDPLIPLSVKLTMIDGTVLELDVEHSWNGQRLLVEIERKTIDPASRTSQWPREEQLVVFDGKEIDKDQAVWGQIAQKNPAGHLLRRRVERAPSETLQPGTLWDFRLALYILNERSYQNRGWVKQWERNLKDISPFMRTEDFLELLKKEAGSIGKYGYMEQDKIVPRDVHHVKSRTVPESFWGAPLLEGEQVKDLGLQDGSIVQLGLPKQNRL